MNLTPHKKLQKNGDGHHQLRGRPEDRKDEIEKSKDMNDERSEAGWRIGRRPKGNHSLLLVEECQADHVDTDGWLDNCDITPRIWAAFIPP